MTRHDVLNSYDVNEYGIITSPGKFEGEMVYVPSLWDIVLGGMADEEYYEEGILLADIHITSAVDEFPELESGTYTLWESEQGFVHCEMLTTA